MKRLNKKSVILAALGLLIGSGAYLNYQMSKTDTTGMSELTLANLEAMASLADGIDIDGDIYTGDMTGRDDCQADRNEKCGMTVSTPSGGYVEYVAGATHKPGWAS